MKHILVYLCLFAVSSGMALSPLGIQNEITSKTREVAIRSFRLPKDLVVSPKEFKEIVEDQLCERYSVYQDGDKVELVEVSAWVGDLGAPHLTKTKDAKRVPISTSIEVIEAVSDSIYKVTHLIDRKHGLDYPLIYVKVPEGISFEAGEVVECSLVWRSSVTTLPKAGMLPHASYEMLTATEAEKWRKAVARDFYNACKQGETFLVKLPTHELACPGCDGEGYDKEAYAKLQESIKSKKVTMKNSLSSDSAMIRLNRAAKNKPQCKVCKGKKHLPIGEFNLLKLK